MTALERRMAFEAGLTDEQRWQVESGGMPLPTPEDFDEFEQPETDEESP